MSTRFRIKQQIVKGLALGFMYLITGLLAEDLSASGRSIKILRFYVVLLGPGANAKLDPKLHVILHATHAVLQMVISEFFPHIAITMFISNVLPNAAYVMLI
jgi:hypothetical protein